MSFSLLFSILKQGCKGNELLQNCKRIDFKKWWNVVKSYFEVLNLFITLILLLIGLSLDIHSNS